MVSSEWLLRLLPAFIAFAGAWWGTRWGFSKYKKEKFWDATLKSYSNVLTSIEIISFFGLADEHKRVLYQGEGGLTSDSAIFNAAIRELIAASYSQSLYFSLEFNGLVRDFIVKANVSSVINHDDLIGEDEDGIRSIIYRQSEKLKAVAFESLELLNVQAKKDIRGHGIREKMSCLKKIVWRR
ncbi:hypothetical protein AB6896_13945 [Rahnella inusitata]|uniref:hypothetical protein n=1 Tax=Rahnella inusitata TaxID=58169 RepID=UPI0039BDDF1C